MNVDNIEDLASFLHNDAIIDPSERAIYFPSGPADEKLMEVPIGKVNDYSAIAITVGVIEYFLNQPDVDRDPKVGIADESGTYNLFRIQDVNDYWSLPPCYHFYNVGEDRILVKEHLVPATFKFTFYPKSRFAACETAQQGGYRNTGRFLAQLDLTKPLYLQVRRDSNNEDYYFQYFLVEIYE